MIGSASMVNPGLTPVPSTATLAFFASASIFFASDAVLPDRIRQLLGGAHDRDARLEHRLDLRHHLLQRRARAQDDDVRLRAS